MAQSNNKPIGLLLRTVIGVVIATLIGGAFGFFAMGESAQSVFVYHDDSASIAYWVTPARYGETYAPDDPAAILRKTLADPFAVALVRATAPFVDPLKVPVLFGVLSSMFAGVFGFLFGLELIRREQVARWIREFAAAGFTLVCLSAMWVRFLPLSGVGNGGDFLIPLLLATMWGAARKSPWVIGVAVIAAAGLYGSAFLICFSLAALFVFNRDSKKSLLDWRIALALVVSAAVLFMLRLPSLFSEPQPTIGSLRLIDDILSDRSFYPGGRYPLFYSNIWLTLLWGYQGGLTIDLQKIAIALAAVPFILLRPRKSFPLHPALWGLMLIGLTWYAMSWAALSEFFLPSRYMRGTLPIFLAGFTMTAAAHFLADRKRKWSRVLATALLVPVILAISVPFVGGYRFKRVEDIEFVSKIARLPKGAMLAGHPLFTDEAVLFGRHSVTTSLENLLPVFDAYNRIMTDRTEATLRALYASDPEKVLGFCRDYGVSYLLIHKQIFEKNVYGASLNFPEPYYSYGRAQALIHDGRWTLNRDHFPGEIYNRGRNVIVPCTGESLLLPKPAENEETEPKTEPEAAP